MDWREHVTADPSVCHGKACIAGTRVMVSVILDNLAAGQTAADVVEAYHVTADDVRAGLLYAAELAKERIVAVPSSDVHSTCAVMGRKAK